MRALRLSLFALFCMLGTQVLHAVIATPEPVTIMQRDGSTITIRIHGDEFLHWKTYGNRLVELGTDGLFYYAQWSDTGVIQPTATRVVPVATRSAVDQGGAAVQPPVAARMRAAALRAARNASAPSPSISNGEHPFLVLLVQFTDLSFKLPDPLKNFHDLLNLPGYSENGATGSVFDYFNENSNGAFSPRYTVVGPITVSNSFSYYGHDTGYTERCQEMLQEAVLQADSLMNIDFSSYDVDADGYIDNIFVFYAGHNRAEGAEKTIWPHSWETGSYSVTVDGVRTRSYACTSEFRKSTGTEMCSIGTFCHEFGHVLGLPDFYDTNYETNGTAPALRGYSLMSSGNYNNNGRTPPYLTAIERQMLGWMETPPALSESGQYTLAPISQNTAFTTSTSTKGEYFLYENRPQIGWDAALPAGGLLIYHVDQSDRMVNGMTAAERWEYGSEINAMASHQCLDLVESVAPESAAGVADIPFAGPSGNTSFTASTYPAALDWNGHPTGHDLTAIERSGEDILITLSVDHAAYISGTVLNTQGNPVPGATLTFTPIAADNPTQTSGTSRHLMKWSAEAQPTGTHLAATQATEPVTTTTQSDGSYLALLSDGAYAVSATAPHYIESSTVITAKLGYTICDFTLSSVAEGMSTTLKKHYGYSGNCWGDDASTTDPYYGAVGFDSTQLDPYAGYRLESISFLNYASSAQGIGVVVYRGDSCIISHPMETPVFNVTATVDMSAFDFRIAPGEADLRFGYYVAGSFYAWPLAIDYGPGNPKGGLYSRDGVTWTDEISTSGYNLIISVTLRQVVTGNAFDLLEFATIPQPQNAQAGQVYTFTLEHGRGGYSAIQWYFNDIPVEDGSQLTLPAGAHQIKAVITYPNRVETIIQEINCL